jgi:REP element-mobilizing transposase RayT
MLSRFSNTYFFTATNLNWINILETNEAKDIILQSLQYLVAKKRIILFGYTIMPNHIHLIWNICEGEKLQDVQRDFLKFTAQQIKFYLQENNQQILNKLLVNAKDRKYQIWERNPKNIEIENELIFAQKLEYMHNNPLQKKWKLCTSPTDYKFSSAKFYETSVDKLFILTNCTI